MLRCLSVACAALLIANACAAAPPSGPPGAKPVARELRGVWVATVDNIDWPSKPGLPVDKQKQEFIAILDKCVELNINAVIFQIRPQADALYDSKLEPWSEFLTGKMGQAPNPYYDPLEFAVKEAHRRGLQLHAWLNPYRVRIAKPKGEASANHASVAHADIVRKYGKLLISDPGESASEDAFIAALKDVVTRYDIDGVHIDDYFYPYAEKDKAVKIVPFPDDDTYKKAVAAGETLKRDDWRRKNVDHLVQRMYDEVKQIKPWVLVGISPIGIWRPDNPKGIKGFDAYSEIFADTRKWTNEGWLDYVTPQIYWKVDSKDQPYGKLLAWWADQNVKQRHLWPGNFTSKVGVKPDKEDLEKLKKEKKKPAPPWTADDILQQIAATRAVPGATGNVHFSMKALMKNKDGIADKLKAGPYAEPALVPESPWLGHETPEKPEITAKRTDTGVAIEMEVPTGKEPWQWLVRVTTTQGLKTSILPGAMGEQVVAMPSETDARYVTVSGISRLGHEGQSTRVKIAKRD
jgi:uncharacterized lipoprotein YddW (UPF0748 family)